MRTLAAVLILLVMIPAWSSAGLGAKITCEVGLDPLGDPGPDSVTLHSAGLGRVTNVFGQIAWGDTISGFHELKRQNTTLQFGEDMAENGGEVHTYTRADVPLGYVYEAGVVVEALDEHPEGAFCSDTHIVEDPNPPEEGGEEGGSSDPPGSGSGEDPIPTPILIDLDRAGFRLTDLPDGVTFDLNRDGIAEPLSWTDSGSGDAWLALDRNQNGLIDDGGELFGNFTDQPASSEPDGFKALRVFDDDDDGRITPSDPIFGDLLLWVDRSQDGVSQPFELSTLAAEGVAWLELNPVESRRRDMHGNEFRYKANVRLWRGMTQSVDVFLLSP